jgi:hypothetical protein
MSIMTEDREQQLFFELKLVDWDIVLLNETWRPLKEEIWTSSGHLFLGAGGTAHSAGVAIILNKRWVQGFQGFKRTSERLCSLDLKVAGRMLRFIVPYMPTTWHSDALVEGMYSELSKICEEAKARGRVVTVGGDFNAVVGSRCHGESENVIGDHGLGERNERGQRLVDWATAENLMILNTKLRKPVDKQWTHQRGEHCRLIDYFLCEKRRWIEVRNLEATYDINVGTDHRCVNLLLRIKAPQTSRRKPRSRKADANLRGWKATDEMEYQGQLDAALLSAAKDDQLLKQSLEDRCLQIEDLLLEVGRKSQATAEQCLIASSCLEGKLKELIGARKAARQRGDKTSEARAAKLVQKEMKALTESRKRAKIDQILHQFRDLKRITGIRTGDKRAYVGNVRNPAGDIQSDRQAIADAFAEFYAELYACRDNDTGAAPVELPDSFESIPPVTAEELRTILRPMANRKSADAKGVVVELLKQSSSTFLQTIADLFNDVLSSNASVPAYWQQNLIKVLFKKGSPELVENYRPITILPILYKVFSKMLCARVNVYLSKAQSVDQAGFRSGFSCDDHLFVITLLSEMFAEFRRPLWIIAIDFRRAFDSINHQSLWTSLLAQGVPNAYVRFLLKLYDGQSGQVQTDCRSKSFRIERGVRQGDPISPILFNSALEDLMRKLSSQWAKKKGYGIQVDNRKLTNLRFADDLLLCANSFASAKSMLSDLMRVAEEYGLEVHETKTKFMWNGHGEGAGMAQTTVRGRPFEILDTHSSTMYLGRLFSFNSTHDVELKNRIGKAWGKFAMYRSELTGKWYDLDRRIKLFKAVVQPTLLYGCSGWTLTRERENMIRATQRKMMRRIMGTRREVIGDQIESWVDWVIRATRKAEDIVRKFDVPDWVEEVHRRRFRWAGHVARRHDGRWTREVLTWSVAGSRARGRPLARWTDTIIKFFNEMWGVDIKDNSFWLDLAEERERWQAAEPDYIAWVLRASDA